MVASSPDASALRFLFDQHVSGPALRQLREKGIDVVHAAEVGLSAADDPAWIEAAEAAGTNPVENGIGWLR